MKTKTQLIEDKLPLKKQVDVPGILTVKEAALFLRLSEATILRLAAQGIVPGSRIGRQWRFSREAIFYLIKHPEQLSQGEGVRT